MITFLFLLCFTLIGILFFCLIIISQRLNQLKELEKSQQKIISQIEETFSGYIMQIKEENEHFFRKASSSILTDQTEEKEESKERSKSTVYPESNVHTVINNKPIVSKHTPFSIVEQTISEDDLKGLLPEYKDIEPIRKVKNEVKVNVTPVTPPTSEQLLIDKIISMENEGASIEDIAKKLNRGKTEIELLLKFRQK